jgi:hypothetical protein
MFSFGHLPDQLLSTGAGPFGADISEPTTPVYGGHILISLFDAGVSESVVGASE